MMDSAATLVAIALILNLLNLVRRRGFAGIRAVLRRHRFRGIRARTAALNVIAAGLLVIVLAGCGSAPPAASEQGEELAQAAPVLPEEAGGRQGSSGGQAGTPGEQAGPSAGAAGEAQQAAESQAAYPARITEAKVVRVIDGDTVEVQWVAGAELPSKRVRLIGIDTPEVSGEPEPFGEEATLFTREQVLHKTVWLEKDVSETDRYGRALRYLWLTRPPDSPDEDQVRAGMLNALLLARGLARLATFPPDVKYVDVFTALQREAREAGVGLWAPAGSPSRPEGEGDTTAAGKAGSGSRSSQAGPGSSKGGSGCDPAYPDVCIPPPPPDLDCGDLEYRGFRALPPDPHRLDGDGDGIACEG